MQFFYNRSWTLHLAKTSPHPSYGKYSIIIIAGNISQIIILILIDTLFKLKMKSFIIISYHAMPLRFGWVSTGRNSAYPLNFNSQIHIILAFPSFGPSVRKQNFYKPNPKVHCVRTYILFHLQMFMFLTCILSRVHIIDQIFMF